MVTVPVTWPVRGRSALRASSMSALMRSPASATIVPAGVRIAGRGATLDELEADFLLLKFLDLLGHCRGRDHEDVGGGNDAAFTRDGQKERQAAGVSIHANSFVK